MILWINGSFGVGKTTIAEELNKATNDSFLYDPEKIGALLRDNLRYNYDDFQDYYLWRKINFEILLDLSKHYEMIIVPMTLTNIDYYNEIINELIKKGIEVKHIILTASKETIFDRLDKREDATPWAYEQVDRCIKAFNEDIQGEKIVTDNKNINEVVQQILEIIS